MDSSNNNAEEENDSMNIQLTDTEWSVEHEKILIEWADKAMCYRWLHSKANAVYSSLNAWYTIPVIVISTLTGTANFAQTRVPDEYQNYYAMVVGGFNILGGIISTVQQFLKITQLNEAHRVSGIAWDKFYRNIKIELAKHPNERTSPSQILKMCKEEFDRLMETSPVIPDKVIKSFSKAFKDSEEFLKISKPEICDVMISTESFRNPWSTDDNKDKRIKEYIKLQNLKELNEKKMIENQNNIVSDFKSMFQNLHNREPMQGEIIDNLKDKIDLPTLKKIIETQEQESMKNSQLLVDPSNNV
jgi:hypothetical protein